MEKEQIISQKLGIHDARTLRQVLKNTELSTEIVQRDVISHDDLCEEFNVSPGFLKDLKKAGKISYFNTTGKINTASRGSKFYYFRDEIEDILGSKINYYSTARVRYNLMNKFIVQIAKVYEPERHCKILEMYLVYNMSSEQIAEELILTNERVRNILNKVCRRTVLDLKRVAEFYPRERDILSLKIERERLLQMNTQLRLKFEKSVEYNQLRKDTSQLHVKHFIDNKIPLEYLDQKIEQMELCTLSVRILSCLRLADIKTLDDLLVHRLNDIRKFRNIGETSISELQRWLYDNFKWSLS